MSQQPTRPERKQDGWLAADMKRHVVALLLTLAFALVLAAAAGVAGALGLDIFPLFR